MKNKAYILADNIISPLGFTTAENFERLKKKETGVKRISDPSLSPEPVCAALIDPLRLEAEFKKLGSSERYTRLEKMVILSMNDSIENSGIDIKSKRTLIVFSTTKGNIDLLDPENAETFDKKRLYLWETANVIGKYFGNPNTPLVVSNACISGVLAIILGKRLLEGNEYDTIVVTGADIMTHFVISGFQSFKAVSSEVAKPYDAKRDGISLGEAAGTIILSNVDPMEGQSVTVLAGSSSNDANHISGPSRTGDGLFLAISKAMEESGIGASDVDFISGHGTATLYNDDMESLAITDAGLAEVPMNSLKSYFGHTLGAAGIIESVIGLQSLRENTLIGTYNFTELGVPKPVNILKDTTARQADLFLKTAAGFGGCNAAVLFQKTN
ncbi:MAG: beta-ketoacyl-[acyl-carrier-protein] synthase family protein [Bacteroidia bacterium]